MWCSSHTEACRYIASVQRRRGCVGDPHWRLDIVDRNEAHVPHSPDSCSSSMTARSVPELQRFSGREFAVGAWGSQKWKWGLVRRTLIAQNGQPLQWTSWSLILMRNATLEQPYTFWHVPSGQEVIVWRVVELSRRFVASTLLEMLGCWLGFTRFKYPKYPTWRNSQHLFLHNQAKRTLSGLPQFSDVPALLNPEALSGGANPKGLSDAGTSEN